MEKLNNYQKSYDAYTSNECDDFKTSRKFQLYFRGEKVFKVFSSKKAMLKYKLMSKYKNYLILRSYFDRVDKTHKYEM